MKITLHISCDAWASARVQSVMDAKRGALLDSKVLYPRAPGRKNHTRLGMAVSDPHNIDTLRFNRGFAPAAKQAELLNDLHDGLVREIGEHDPDHMVLSAHQLGTCLVSPSELQRLRDLLQPMADRIEVVICVVEPATALARHFDETVQEGRVAPLARDLGLLDAPSWWDAAQEHRTPSDPAKGVFAEVQSPPQWLDTNGMVAFWSSAFDHVRLAHFDENALASERAPDEIGRVFDLPRFGKSDAVGGPGASSDVWLTRAVAYNDLLLKLIATKGFIVPRQLWRKLINDLKVPGDSIDPGALSAVTTRFMAMLDGLKIARPVDKPDYTAPDSQFGFRASQYLMADLGRIRRTHKDARADRQADLEALSAAPTRRTVRIEGLSQTARNILPPAAQANFQKLQTSPMRPHNKMGLVNEEELAAAFPPAPKRTLKQGSTGNVIVACMKNEAPYIVEWVAYHRAIGVDNFLIYTNGCEDSTSRLLDRMQELGIVEHRQNEDWKGNSPQQFALNNALKERVVKKADWLIHIDVDEFMNIRCGNGTLDDFFARVPDATNVAMTWRLFGHNGITDFKDEMVIDQFDTCAPKFCPKPHTVWGFKTMFANIGAYEKMSCHRPNKLKPGKEKRVKWVNGSGQDMTDEAIKGGWRSSKKSIGYDLLQLNHYALRSADSFLIKRQRGRALHVDRSIGLNYWIRMDWSDFRDITIKRNIPRVRAEMDAILNDAQVQSLHNEGLDWHRAKAAELHKNPEFAELYEQALQMKLTETERVAYALALDLES